MTTICPGGGAESAEGMKFCGQCATPLMNRCPSCGFDNPAEFKFCGECATSMSRDVHVTPTPLGSEIRPTLPPGSGGSSAENPEEVALEVAKEWTLSSIDNLSHMLGMAVTEGTPMLQNVASSLIRNQIKQKVEWTYADPEHSAQDRYRLIATGSAPLEVGLLTLKWSSTASADFEMLIDIVEKRILESKMVPQSFKVIASNETDKLQERVSEEVEKVKGKLKGFFTR